MYNALMSAWLFIWVACLVTVMVFFTYYVLFGRNVKKESLMVVVEGEKVVPCQCCGEACNTIEVKKPKVAKKFVSKGKIGSKRKTRKKLG